LSGLSGKWVCVKQGAVQLASKSESDCEQRLAVTWREPA